MIAALRGTHDILPGEVEKWQLVEARARELCARYGYVELRTPVLEAEELFAKGTGESTDIVQKEMYTFTDRGGERVTLRPEATPSMVRAFVEHNLEQALPSAKLFALGPMFRYERPQKGRYRQFHQFDVEVFGVTDPAIDAEVIDLAWALVRELGIEDTALVINSVGCAECRPAFQAALLEALGDDLPKLCVDCQRRATTNPLRIYDCKVEADQPIIDRLPHSVDYLCGPCAAHFAGLQRYLGVFGVPWEISHRLVRGLDYYTRTTFEILGRTLGAQNALLGRRALRRPRWPVGRTRPAGDRLRGRPRAARAGAAGVPRRRCRRRAPSWSRLATTGETPRWSSWRSCGGPASRRKWSSIRAACGAR